MALPLSNTTRTKQGVVYPVGGHGEVDAMSDSDGPRLNDEEEATEDGEGVSEDIIPEGYDSEGEFLAHWLKQYTRDAEYDAHNIEEAMEDLRFIYVDQWDPDTRAEREEAGRPCITVNTLPQYIGQVVGDRRINKTSIKVVATTAGSKKAAEVRSGLIKTLENFSGAERIYDACCEDQVGAGISNFEVGLEYAKNDVFNQDVVWKSLDNPFAVVWDRKHRDPTGKDARHCFVQEEVDEDDFKKEWGIAVPDGFPFSDTSVSWSEWCSEGTVKIAALWIMVDKPATFALMADGQVEDVTDYEEASYAYRLYYDPQTGVPLIKEGVRTYAQRWMISGFKILEGPYELPLSRLPIIKVSGRVGRVGTKQYRFGLVRWARDPSLMRNYWRSIAVETLAMAPRNVWLADAASVKGREEDFRSAHLTGDPLLVYNTGKNAPKLQDSPQLPMAVLNEASMNAQDIKDVTGIHDASLGIRSNEVSGKAIMARQREGDVATITFHDNLNLSILEGGTVANELIPVAFDTVRTLVITGSDEREEFVTVNDPQDEASPNIIEGKYLTQLVTGPSYTTQRMEAADAMLEAVKVFPQLMEVAGDILVEVQDWPGSDRISARLKKVLPAAQQEEAEKEAEEQAASGQPMEPPQPSPEEQMAAQAMQMQMQMQQAQMQFEMEKMKFETQKMQFELQEAQQRLIAAQADAQIARANARAAEYKADEAQAKAEQADDGVEINRALRAAELRERESRPAPATQNPKPGRSSRAKKGNRQ